MELLTIILVRCGSDRFPDKVIQDVGGKPLLVWIWERLAPISDKIIIATTDQPEDDKIEKVASDWGIGCYRHNGPVNDVVGRVDAVVKQNPQARFIFKALGDCPFIEPSIVSRAVRVLDQTSKDLFLWYLDANHWPVYGAREFPIPRQTWEKIAGGATSKEFKEHPDMWLNHNRDKLDIIYHDLPPRDYFRHPQQIRLEVDYPQDVEMIRGVVREGPGMLAPLRDVVRWLDVNSHISKINWGLEEKTGPVVSYDHKTKIGWTKLMEGAAVMGWDNHIRQPLNRDRARKISCQGCGEFVGWGSRGGFYHRDNERLTIREGFIPCPSCVGGVAWTSAKSSGRGRG